MGKQENISLKLLNEIKKLKEANEILKNQKEFSQTNKLNFDSIHLFFMKCVLPMWVYDKHTYFVLDVNKAACEIYDYGREEFLKMSILDFRPKKDKERLLADLKKPRQEMSFSKGWRHQFKNGQVIDVEISSQELYYEGKESVMVVANDITSGAEHKNMAKQSEEKFRLITSHAKDAIILMDEKGCVTLWNPAAEKIFGFTQEEVIGNDLHSFIMPLRYGEQMKRGFSHFIKSGQGPLIGNVIEIEALHKSGHEFPISISLTAFKLNNKWNSTATIRDITEQKTKQQKYLQSEEKEKKRADELAIANKQLAFQYEEKQKRAEELAIANKELAFQNEEKQKRADELAIANKELAFQKKLDVYRSEMESVAHDLTRLIDTANAPIFGIDSKGLVNEWNQSSEKITGFKKKEVLGKNLVETYITEDYRKSVKLVLDNALKGNEIANYEFPLFTKDNQRVMVLLNSSTRRNADGKIVGVLGVGQDISQMDKLRTETEAVATELRQFIETANAPIFGIDSKGLVNEWNQSSEKITGFKKKEVLGKNLVETYITEDYRKSVKLVLDNALKGNEIANYEFPLFTKDNQRVMVLLNSSTRRNVDGKIVGVLGVGQDISQMDKLRSETESVATELRQFIETANAPILGIDAKGNVNEWNQTSEKITGFKKEEVLGKNLVETYITEDYREAVKLVLDNALKGMETANFEFPLFTKDNHRVMVLLNSSTRRNADGKIVGVLGVGQDISQMDKLRTEMDNYKSNLEETVKKRTFELENSLEKVEELGILKTSFVAMASHEFRTPLAAIQAATDVILKYKDKLSQEDIDKRLFKIKKEIKGMVTMLEDILIMGKSDVQKLEFNATELDLVVLVKNIISEYQLTQEIEREVIFQFSSNKIMLIADPKWINSIVINLFSNALKYSEPPSSISIEIRHAKNEVILSVTDKGIGISEKDQKSLFDPFHRGENVGDIQGTGLGLSVIEKAIDLHKGKIKVESKLNNGSTFIVSLPYAKTV